MKKRIFAIMLALAMLLAAVPALAEEVAVEQDNTAGNNICATDKCNNPVANEGDICTACAEKKAEEAAAKKAAEEEALRKAAEEQKITEEKNAKKSPMLLGEVNPAGTGADGNCHHDHTVTWANAHPEVQGTMVENPAKDPTCTSEGNIKYYTCTKCDRYFRRNEVITDRIEADEISAEEVKIPKTKHKPTKIAAKAATCTETGNIEYYECSVCKGQFADSTGTQPAENIVIPVLGHTMSEDVTYPQKPTCTNAGKATYTCGRCKAKQENVNVPALGHDYGDPTWNWCGVSSATATFKCKRNCKEKNAIVTCQVRPTRSSINNCGYYTYTATVEFNDNTYTDTRTDYSCRPDWYYDPCYYNNPCGHWGCGNVCTRYSDCVPCRDYRTTFRVGGYNCLATPKTGDVSVMAPAMLALIGAAGAMLGKKRR